MGVQAIPVAGDNGGPPALPPFQQAIRSRCVHPSGVWIDADPDALAPTLHGAFEAQAARTPDRIAVASPARRLSYRALNEEANRVARAIIADTAPADDPVAICCSLGASQLVAMLALAKAGRFFFSLSASDPATRNRALLASMGARMVVTDRANLATARALAPKDCGVLDVDAPRWSERIENPHLPARTDELVRIALTSGSTGEPKGIMQTHRATLRGAVTRNNAVHLCAEDRFLIVTPVFTELWRPLLVGATLYLFDIKADDVDCLRRWMVEEHISALRSTPSVFRQLVAVLAPEPAGSEGADSFPAPSLRVIESIGEPVPAECVLLYQKHFSPRCIFVNFLGSKEVLDYRVNYVDHATRVAERLLPAGYALGDARVTLLDEAGNPAGPGKAGEIAVCSRSMSPGYWRRADVTAARFRNDPADGGRRVHRTGDLGLLLPDGCLVWLGRLDFMVKIRGQRVDLSHVEQTLRDLPSVSDAAVIVKEGVREDPTLVAFIVASALHRPSERELRRALATTLPDVMIPSALVFLDTLPTTAMGKTDRERLRVLAPTRPPEDVPAHLPRTLVEAELAAVWAEVLARDQIGLLDNFFELGGNSLMVMRVVAKVQRRFGIDLALSTLFQLPTVQALARHVSQALRASQRAETVSSPSLKPRPKDADPTHREVE